MPTPTSFFEGFNDFLASIEVAKPLVPTYIHLLGSALFCIYVGSHASLSRPSSAAKPPKRGEDEDEEDTDEEEGIIQKMEGLNPSDAIMLPIVSGLTLGGLYLLLKHFDPAVLNKVLNWYFSHAGFMFAAAFLRDGLAVLKSFVFPEHYSSSGSVWKADKEKCIFIEVAREKGSLQKPRTRGSPLPGFLGGICLPGRVSSSLWTVRAFIYKKATLRAHVRSILNIKIRFTALDAMSIAVALCVSGYAAFVARPWWLINFLGFGFSYGALQLLSPTTFAAASLILGSLFFYDIYFVFYTPMMVTVAKKIDLPIKLLFPRPPTLDEDPSLTALAMLGLGDIVVPGTMIGLALRFDLYLHYLRIGSTTHRSKNDTKLPKYVTATGRWGERFWTGLKSSRRLSGEEASQFEGRYFQKTYFKASIVGYTVGMLATLVAMQISNHPQPALLYLVPGVITSVWLTALARGEIPIMWNFSDGVDDEDEEPGSRTEQEKEEHGLLATVFGKIFGVSKHEGSSSEGSTSHSKGDRSPKCTEKEENNGLSPIEIISMSITLPPTKKKPVTPATTDPQSTLAPIASAPASDILKSDSPIQSNTSEMPFKKRRTR